MQSVHGTGVRVSQYEDQSTDMKRNAGVNTSLEVQSDHSRETHIRFSRVDRSRKLSHFDERSLMKAGLRSSQEVAELQKQKYST